MKQVSSFYVFNNPLHNVSVSYNPQSDYHSDKTAFYIF